MQFTLAYVYKKRILIFWYDPQNCITFYVLFSTISFQINTIELTNNQYWHEASKFLTAILLLEQMVLNLKGGGAIKENLI